MSNNKITLWAVLSPIAEDRLMHSFDVFEPFKILIEDPITISGTMEPGNTTKTCIAETRAVLQRDGKYRVVAIWREGHKTGAYHDTAIKSVSFGTMWCPFVDLLRNLDYPGI